ncbi:hypothetical protein ACIPPS_20570 [Streptomyces sp. NPDC090127]|uniref:hypothetical protein n=1 Tax=Streptomyces sp. NPDC090127 TaxID=3365953 RepID=UPI00380E01D9
MSKAAATRSSAARWAASRSAAVGAGADEPEVVDVPAEVVVEGPEAVDVPAEAVVEGPEAVDVPAEVVVEGPEVVDDPAEATVAEDAVPPDTAPDVLVTSSRADEGAAWDGTEVAGESACCSARSRPNTLRSKLRMPMGEAFRMS